MHGNCVRIDIFYCKNGRILKCKSENAVLKADEIPFEDIVAT